MQPRNHAIPFGYWLFERACPDLAFDFEQIPSNTLFKSSVDELALALESIGSGSAFNLRTRAMVSLGEHLVSAFFDARTALVWLAEQDRALGAWGACACARESLAALPPSDRSVSGCLETAEGSLAYLKSEDDLFAAITLASDCSVYAHANEYSAATHATDAVLFSAESAYFSRSRFNTKLAASVQATAHSAARALAENESLGSPCDGQLRTLVSVIARALPGFPVQVLQ